MAEIAAKLDQLGEVEIGPELFIVWANIADLKEQDVNAHVMVQDKLLRLTENIRTRGAMESLAYCAQPAGKGTPIEIVSGHHRVRAARGAGMTMVPLLVDRSKLTRSAIVAKQLAHNALVGTDDMQLVKDLLKTIDNVDDLLATGLPADLLPTPDAFKVTLFAPHADYKFKTCTFTFLSHQVEKFDELVKAIKKDQPNVICIACEEQFEPFLKAVAEYASRRNIISAGTAIGVLINTALEANRTFDAEKAAAEAESAQAPTEGTEAHG